MNNIPQIFNRKKVRQHRQRSANMSDSHNFLLDEIARRLVERIKDVADKTNSVLNLGCASRYLNQELKLLCNDNLLVNQDFAYNMVCNTAGGVVADEENLPYKNNTFDLVASNLVLHLTNDLPGCLIQVKNILKDKGLFVASLYGGETLKELRQMITQVESNESGGVAPRVHPFVNVPTMGALMQRAGFSEPVLDSDQIKVSYNNIFDLMHDIRGMGETNALFKGGRPMRKSMVEKIDMEYKRLFGDGEKGILATFDVVNVVAVSNNK